MQISKCLKTKEVSHKSKVADVHVMLAAVFLWRYVFVYLPNLFLAIPGSRSAITMIANTFKPLIRYLQCQKTGIASSKPIAAVFLPLQSRLFCSSQSTKSSSPQRIIFSGIQPTGIPHLGNYLGALREWVRLQDSATEGSKLFFSVVDLHALTVPQESTRLRQWRKETFATLLAIGLDPSRSTIFYQSAVCTPTSLFLFWKSLLFTAFTESCLGACTCRVNVDFEYSGFNGLSFAHDSVESASLISMTS